MRYDSNSHGDVANDSDAAANREVTAYAAADDACNDVDAYDADADGADTKNWIMMRKHADASRATNDGQ